MASRPFGSYGDFAIEYGDAGAEFSSVKGTAKVVVAGEIAADGNSAAQLALFDTFITRTNALVLGDFVKSSYINTAISGFTRPTNGAARETKLLVQYENIETGKRYTMTVPTLNPTIPVYVDNVNAKDVIRMDTPTAITQFITAFNAFVVDPQSPGDVVDGSYAYGDPACRVIGLKVVGRNN